MLGHGQEPLQPAPDALHQPADVVAHLFGVSVGLESPPGEIGLLADMPELLPARDRLPGFLQPGGSGLRHDHDMLAGFGARRRQGQPQGQRRNIGQLHQFPQHRPGAALQRRADGVQGPDIVREPSPAFRELLEIPAGGERKGFLTSPVSKPARHISPGATCLQAKITQTDLAKAPGNRIQGGAVGADHQDRFPIGQSFGNQVDDGLLLAAPRRSQEDKALAALVRLQTHPLAAVRIQNVEGARGILQSIQLLFFRQGGRLGRRLSRQGADERVSRHLLRVVLQVPVQVRPRRRQEPQVAAPAAQCVLKRRCSCCHGVFRGPPARS